MTRICTSLCFTLLVAVATASQAQQSQAKAGPDMRQPEVKSGTLRLISATEADLDGPVSNGVPEKLVFVINGSTKFDGVKTGDIVNVIYVADGLSNIAVSIRAISSADPLHPSKAGGNASVQPLTTPDRSARDAGQSADAANHAAQEAYNRTDSLSGAVANLDNYKELSDVSVTFGFDKYVLTAADKKKLDDMAANLTGSRGYILELTGGTDSVGDANSNYQLSQRRADAVANYLQTKYNIPPYKFYIVGIGKDQQVASDSTAAGRASNRRVEVKLLANASDKQ
jgi:outer membrane protein OmpA-like peptidoglycan-associated protein